jgi:hypothetical protein
MESMRESWTDKRLDDLNEKVGSSFERFEALHRLLIQSAAVLLAALIGLHFV